VPCRREAAGAVVMGENENPSIDFTPFSSLIVVIRRSLSKPFFATNFAGIKHDSVISLFFDVKEGIVLILSKTR